MIYPIAVIGRIARSFNYRAATSISCPPHGLIVKTDPKNDLAKRHPQIFNLQFSIPAWPGWVKEFKGG
jgi:hypothetical protein